MYAGVSGIEDSFWSGPEPVTAMPRRSSFPALAISSLWKALPSSGQRPTQRAQSLGQPTAFSRTHPPPIWHLVRPNCKWLSCICPVHQPCASGCRAVSQASHLLRMDSGPASASLAEDIPARARLLGATSAHGQNRGDTLGLQSHLLPYWQAGVDPTEAWHAYEKHVRVIYAK